MAEFKKQYNPNRSADWNYGGRNWKLSRSKIELFVECPRCFYLDNKLGTARPRGPSFTLNIAVDELFKQEFDVHRKNKTPHPIMTEFGIDAVPYYHKDIDAWRDNFTGITYEDKSNGFIISGAIDDLWENKDGSLSVVDYKATCKDEKIESLSKSGWEDSYKRQMGVYQWLLTKNNFPVSPIGYFVYANAQKQGQTGFADTLHFETTVIPCEGDTGWIDETLPLIKLTLEADTLPASGKNCEYCAYREASGKKLQTIFHANKKTK
jgi:hypothetical protein